MNENEFQFEGKTFIAIQEHEPCEGCTMERQRNKVEKFTDSNPPLPGGVQIMPIKNMN